MDEYFLLEKHQKINKKILNFFSVSNAKLPKLNVYLVGYKGDGAGGTFCEIGSKYFFIMRAPIGGGVSVSAFWHEYIHFVSNFSDLYLKRHDEMVQAFNLDKNIRLHPSSIVSEGMAYVAKPTIRKKELPKRNIEKSVGIHRAWGKYREQTLASRSYSDLQNIMDTIPDDWGQFMKWWEESGETSKSKIIRIE